MSFRKPITAITIGVVLLFFKVAGSLFAQSTWQRVDLGTDLTLISVFFINPDVGWLGGRTCPSDSSFFRTTDGGQTWQLISILPPCDGANGIFFVNQSHGFVVGRQDSWETTDGGVIWQPLSLELALMNAITFSDSLNGWMVGDYNTGNLQLRIFHSSDGGKTWQQQTAPGNLVVLTDVAFADSLNGWAAGGATLHTTDGGRNWSFQTLPGSGVDKISVISPATALGISGNDDQFVKFTYDSGKTWQQRQFTQDNLFGAEDIMFSDSLHGCIVGNTIFQGQGFAMTIYRTTDGGATWAEEARGLYGRGLNAVCTIDSLHVWAVGSDGSVVDYGYVATGVEDSSRAIIPRQYTLYQNYPNPFNSRTLIRFTLKKADRIRLSVYDLLGRRVRTLIDSFTAVGTHKVDWDGRDDSNKMLPSGVYIYQLKTKDFSETKKMVLLK